MAESESGIDGANGVSDEQAASHLEDMVGAARKGMAKCSFFVAHANSQHINGISESNTKSAKSIMKSLVGSIQRSQCTYPSFVKVSSTFERVADLLNSRPIFHSASSVLSVKDIMFPSNMSNSLYKNNDNDLVISFMNEKAYVDAMGSPGVMTLIASADSIYQEFC